MGASKKPQADGNSSDPEAVRKWAVSSGGVVAVKAMKPISTRGARPRDGGGGGDGDDAEAAQSTTPTAKEARIPEKLPCPPAPRKRRPPPSTCHMLSGVREFFSPPDLETVFKRHVERGPSDSRGGWSVV